MKKALMILVAILVVAPACKKPDAAKPVEPVKPVAVAEVTFGPVVAGAFYPAAPSELRSMIDGFLSSAQAPELKGRLLGVMCPHAGYQFSGPVAAYSYKAVAASGRKKFVVIAPSHYVRMDGVVGVLDADYYATPLGKVKIDRAKVKELLGKGGWLRTDRAIFDQEHAAEVQLPFLQAAVGGDIQVVVIVMPDQRIEMVSQLAKTLKEVFPEPDWLFIASSDMSHYHVDQEAKAMDKKALALIEKLDIDGLWKAAGMERTCELCGLAPVLTVMTLAQSYEEPVAKVLIYKNSFDTTGQMAERVVGYGSAVFTVKPEPEKPATGELEPPGGSVTLEEKRELMKIAKETVQSCVMKNELPNVGTQSARLKEKGAAFVTLTENQQLRGCIGHIIAVEPLYLCVREVACKAAKEDPRFKAVTPAELDKLEYEISVLSPMMPVKDVKTIEVGKDGLLMKSGYYQGVLLPQVPGEFGWDREQFLKATCNKAGMPDDCWTKPDTEIYHFRGIVFSEKDLK